MGNLCAGPRKPRNVDFDHLLETQLQKEEKYTDQEFPPQAESLIKNWNEEVPEVQELVEEWRQFQWIRAEEIPSLNDEEGKLAIFADGIVPDDIKQGALGDCYFLSALAALAEHPRRVEKLFATKETNKAGMYGV